MAQKFVLEEFWPAVADAMTSVCARRPPASDPSVFLLLPLAECTVTGCPLVHGGDMLRA